MGSFISKGRLRLKGTEDMSAVGLWNEEMS